MLAVRPEAMRPSDDPQPEPRPPAALPPGRRPHDISTPAGRRAAWTHLLITDHGLLRLPWRNLWQISPGVWRSNQPSPGRIARHARSGISTILNLRGASAQSFYLFEVEACRRHGIDLVDLRLNARTLSPPAVYLALLDRFETLPRPFLMHCKSGADRAGLAAALYLIHMDGVPAARAAGQLSLRFVHRRRSLTGVLDALIAAYGAGGETCGMSLRQWLTARYDPAAITAGFAAGHGR